MASLPLEFHIRGLIDTLKLGDKADDVVETMIQLYESEDIACSGRCSRPRLAKRPAWVKAMPSSNRSW
jgi:uncharacterized protein YbaP (TraB family)